MEAFDTVEINTDDRMFTDCAIHFKMATTTDFALTLVWCSCFTFLIQPRKLYFVCE